jgi:hypothetical protein
MAITFSTITLDDCIFTGVGLGSRRRDDDCGCGRVRVFDSLSFVVVGDVIGVFVLPAAAVELLHFAVGRLFRGLFVLLRGQSLYFEG